MNSWIKRAVLLLLALIILLGVSACMKKKPDPEAIKAEMMEHLEKKYGEEFVPLSLTLSGFAYSYDQLRAYPKSGSEQDAFDIWGTRMKDGTYSIRDGYFGIYIRPQYEEMMSRFAQEIYKDSKVFVSFGEGVFPDWLTKATKLEEIYREGETFNSDSVIFVKESSAAGKDDEASLNQIAKRMIQHKMVGDVRLYVVKDSKFDDINMAALSAKDTGEYFVRDYKIIMISNNLEILE